MIDAVSVVPMRTVQMWNVRTYMYTVDTNHLEEGQRFWLSVCNCIRKKPLCKDCSIALSGFAFLVANILQSPVTSHSKAAKCM